MNGGDLLGEEGREALKACVKVQIRGLAETRRSGAPNDRFRGNICSEPSGMAKIFGSPRTAKNFENVSW